MQLIKIPSDFRDAWFASDFGKEIQEKFLCRDKCVEIDFSSCAWIDPIPMLALLCHVKRWAALFEAPELWINLGTVAASGVNDESARARLFVVEHGFHKSFAEACKRVVFTYESGLDGVETKFSADAVEDLTNAIRKSSSVHLYYAERSAFPPQGIQSPYDGPKVSEFVDSMVQTVDDNIFRGRRSEFQHRDSTLVRFRQVATEIIGNACEHAYATDNPGPVYAYARIRRHNDHIRIHPSTEARSDVESKEMAPLIHHIHEVTGNRYLELFVCDIGKGLTADAADWYERTSIDQIRNEFPNPLSELPKFPLRKLMSMVFRLPVSRHKRNIETAAVYRSNVTGLGHVNTVLSQHSDRSRIFVFPEWTAGKHPRPENYNGGSSDGSFALVESAEIAPSGSFFHFAIDLTASDLALESCWLKPADNQGDLPHGEFYKLRKSFKPGSSSGFSRVFDLRQHLEGNREKKPATDAEVDRLWTDYNTESGSMFIVRMSRDFRKNLTDRILERWVRDVTPNSSPVTLAFCDLSQAQAILLKDHLARMTFSRLPRGDVSASTVIIIAENLVACALDLRHSTTGNVSSFVVRAIPPKATEIIPIIGRLRRHDTETFWRRVSSLCRKVQLLIKDVQWVQQSSSSSAIRLPVYLDYSLAVQDRELAKILRRSLRRALSAFPELEVHAVDDLIKPDLDDALRWNRDAPLSPPKEPLFVLSSIVTGSTIDRAARHLGSPAAVLSAFFAKSVPSVEPRSMYFSALEWAPLSSFSLLPTERLWERIPGTPLVRPYAESHDKGGKLQRYSLLRRIPRNLEENKPGRNERPSVTQAYDEWHRDRLLRVGHWSVDRRHGLVEIDHTRALQISAESRQGFYNWLASQLRKVAGDSKVCLLVYPASRLNAILIRHLLKMPILIEIEWPALPINYLPDVGDGLRQIAPLTIEQIHTTDAARSGGIAVFIDIGFVGNRTFRHTKRQLLALGIKQVIGMGLLNRTSSPALFEEMEDTDVECYWRVDIPTLDDERSCPVCKGLGALLTLRERAVTFQPALVSCIDEIQYRWALTEPSLSWWDHGLDPIIFPLDSEKKFDKKFGFNLPEKQPPLPQQTDADGAQTLLISNEGEAIAAFNAESYYWASDKVNWNFVHLRTSTQAAAYGIEIARTQAAPDYPWRLARQIAEEVKSKVMASQILEAVTSGAAVAVEIAACHLLLCGGDLTVASREEGANLVLRYLLELESEVINESQANVAEQLCRLRGLAALAFANLDLCTKRLLLDNVVAALSTVRLVNQETSIALMTIVSNLGREGIRSVAPTNSFEELVRSRYMNLNASNETRESANILIWNYRLIAVAERSLTDQLTDALRFFGAGVSHGQLQIVKKAAETAQSINQDRVVGVADPNAGWAVLRSAFLQAHSIICQGWQSTSSTGNFGKVVGELFRALCNLDTEVVSELFRLSQISMPVDRSVAENEADSALSSARAAFQLAFIRIEPLPSGEISLTPLRNKICDLLEFPSLDRHDNCQIRIICNLDKFIPGARADGPMRYVLFGVELCQMIQKLRDEALHYGIKLPVCAPESFAASDVAARLWVEIVGASDGSLQLSLWNQGTAESREDDFKNCERSLAPIHYSLGTLIKRDVVKDGSNAIWFVTRIGFKWIAGGNV